MSRADRCCAGQPARRSPVVWRAARGAAVGTWWLSHRVLAPAAVAAGWAVWVVLSGRTWRHQVRRRLVRREVRAAGNWLAIAVAVGLWWRPLIVAAVLTVAGGCLVAAALTSRHRAAIGPAAGEPIRVHAQVGPPRPLSSGGR